MVDRYFVDIDGEGLLPRSIRQFSEWADVGVLTSNDQIKARLPDVGMVPGSDRRKAFLANDLIRKGLEQCGGERTIVVFGDVYFTDQAVQVIKKGKRRSWVVYGRSQSNPYTGTQWAEWFAFEISGLPATNKGFEALRETVKNYRSGAWPTCKAWDWYYEMEGMPYYIDDVANVPTGDHWVEINDLTDDIDFLGDALNLRRAVRAKG
jgi:NADH:ubiquinone oxidoreductase subunit